jgi:hypothetical protein
MIKLNKQQINALANTFRNELLEVENKKKEVEKENIYKKYKPLFIKVKKILANNEEIDEIYVKLIKNNSSSINRKSDENNWISGYAMNNILKNKNIVTIDKIQNDIILATIDSISVDEIINSLKTKYK